MEWISVKDRLPEKEDYYLACDVDDEWDNEIFMAEFMVEKTGYMSGPMGFYIYNEDLHTEIIVDVTHWMPLPELPKPLAKQDLTT